MQDVTNSGGPLRDQGRRRVLAITLVVLCQSIQSLAYGGIALFLPLVRSDIGLSFSQAGTVASSASLVYALMQIPAGYLADRYGARRLFLMGLLGTNSLALTLSLLHTYPLLLVNQALSGFFRALVFAPGLLLISALFSRDRRATAMGLYVAGGFSSNIFLSSLGPLLVKPLGWRALFVIFSLAGFGAVAAFARFAGGPAVRPGGHVRLRELTELLRYRTLWLVGAVQFIRLAVASSLAFWLPSMLIADKGYSLQTAGLMVAVGAAMTAPSNFLGGYISDRFDRPLLVIGISLLTLAFSLFFLVEAQNLVLLFLLVALNGLFVQVYFGPLFAVPLRLFGLRTAGVTSGFGNFCANMGGSTFVFVLGAVRQATGSFNAGVETLAALCLVGAGCTLLLARWLPSRSDVEHAEV